MKETNGVGLKESGMKTERERWSEVERGVNTERERCSGVEREEGED